MKFSAVQNLLAYVLSYVNMIYQTIQKNNTVRIFNGLYCNIVVGLQYNIKPRTPF